MPQTPGTEPAASRITQLLGEWREGNERALDDLVPLVHGELRRLARQYLHRRLGGAEEEERDGGG